MGKLWLTTNAGAVTTFFEPKKKKKKSFNRYQELQTNMAKLLKNI
jgi:hypothetical protein